MSYPSLPIMRDGSRAERRGGLDPQRASNGALKVRRLYSADKTDFTLVHWLSDTQRATLETCWTSFRTGTVTLTWPETGATFTCRFAEAPQYEWRVGFWVATVKLLEV